MNDRSINDRVMIRIFEVRQLSQARAQAIVDLVGTTQGVAEKVTDAGAQHGRAALQHRVGGLESMRAPAPVVAFRRRKFFSETSKVALFPSFCCAVLLALFTTAALAQSAPTVLYAESFRQGSTHVTEDSFEAKLDTKNPAYRERIKDGHGVDRYEFSIVPQGPEGDTKTTSWQARLADLHHAMYSNVLLTSQEPSQDAKNNLWWFDPGRFAPVAIRTKRIIKVDSFYVTFEVTAYHFTPVESPYLDSMTVKVRFSNADPRQDAGP
jgi:hypothetical protein